MMETIEDRSSDDPERRRGRRDWGRYRRYGNPLSKALMGSFLIEVDSVLFHHLDDLLFIEKEEVIKALPADGANKSFARRVRFRRTKRGSKDLNPCPFRHRPDMLTVLAVIVAEQETRSLPEWRGFAHLLSDPTIGRLTGDPDMHYPPRA